MQVNFIDTPATGGVSAIREAAPARLHAQLGPSELRSRRGGQWKKPAPRYS